MDGIAMGWGIAAAFSLSIACCGPNHLAKLSAAYLFSSWLISNAIFAHVSPGRAMELFAYLDTFAACFFIVVWLARPSIWLGVLTAALVTQIIFQTSYHLTDPELRDEFGAFLANNILFGIQLAAVVGPTFTKQKRQQTSVRVQRRRPRRPKKPHLRLVA